MGDAHDPGVKRREVVNKTDEEVCGGRARRKRCLLRNDESSSSSVHILASLLKRTIPARHHDRLDSNNCLELHI